MSTHIRSSGSRRARSIPVLALRQIPGAGPRRIGRRPRPGRAGWRDPPARFRRGHGVGLRAADQGSARVHLGHHARGTRNQALSQPGRRGGRCRGRDGRARRQGRRHEHQHSRSAQRLHAGAGRRQAAEPEQLRRASQRLWRRRHQLHPADGGDRAHRGGARPDVHALWVGRHGRRHQHHHPQGQPGMDRPDHAGWHRAGR